MRNRKDTADYFPHQAEHGETLFIVMSKWGNDGYTAFFRLLELLCKSDGHFITLEPGPKMIYAAAYCRVPDELLLELVDLLVKLEKIDGKLWKDHKVVWYPSFVEGLAPLYRNRRRELPKKPLVMENPGQKLHVELPETTCRKAVKYSIVKYSRKRVPDWSVKLGLLSEDGCFALGKSTFYFKDVTVKRLTLFGIAERIAIQLTDHHNLSDCHDQMDYLIYRLENENKNRGAGYLVKAIKTPYDVPAGFYEWVQQFKVSTNTTIDLAPEPVNGEHTREEIKAIINNQFK